MIRYREEHKAKESMITREEKVERHFRNSVTDKLIDLMKVMDPGGQRNWSYNYKDLLTAVKERIEAELLHENNFAADAPAKPLTESAYQNALALPKPTSSS